MENLDRRRFLKGSAAAALSAAVPGGAEGRELSLQMLESDLTAESLEKQKEVAVSSLTKSIPQLPQLRHIQDYARHLRDESQMYIPSAEEVRDVGAKSMRALQQLGSKIRMNGHGLLVFADRDGRGNHVQRLYVIRRAATDALQFVKGYRVSTARAGFGNEPGSGKTPLGLHTIPSGKIGMFGEIVAMSRDPQATFVKVPIEGEDHWFVGGFGNDKYNDVAEIVTDQYLLVGPETDPSRGIRIHGTNRAGRVGPNGQWVSHLGGRMRSGGCIRMSSVDVRDMHLSGYIPLGAERPTGDRNVSVPVFIYATERGIAASDQLTEDDKMDMPARLKRPEKREVPSPQSVPPNEPARIDTPRPIQPRDRNALPPDAPRPLRRPYDSPYNK